MTTTGAALILIDMQQAIDDPAWSREGGRNHPNAEIAALRLIDSWRVAGNAIYHVRHDSVEPNSTYRPGQPGHRFKAGFEPADGEHVIPKHTGSAFTATPLGAMLGQRSQRDLVVAGVITNNSVEATVRHAGTLGFRVALAEDACFTFGRKDWNSVPRTATEVHAMSLANLDGEYCRVVSAAEILVETGSTRPVLPYFERPVAVRAWDERAPAVAEYVSGLIEPAGGAGVRVEHVGSTAVPKCDGKGVIDLLVTYPAGGLEPVKHALCELGFQPQAGPDPFPEERPMREGVVAYAGELWKVHAHVIESGSAEADELRWFRDRLRSDSSLRAAYVARKNAIVASGVRDSLEYCYAKEEFIRNALGRR